MASYKCFDYESLEAANATAEVFNLNRTLNEDFFESLDKNKFYPISFSMVHNDDHIRVKFIYDVDGEVPASAWLDMTTWDFEKLPTFDSEAA